MFELSHRLIGIYKTSNVTKSKSHIFAASQILTPFLGISVNNRPLATAPITAVPS